MSDEFRGVTLEGYAELLAQLARAGDEWEARLRAVGLSETDWEAVDAHYQALLEAADDNCAEDEVPEIVNRFSLAFAQSSAASVPILSFEEYASVVRLAQQGAELHRVLEQKRLTISQYLEAHAHYLKLMLADPELKQRFAGLTAQGERRD
jgi:hypothetical protein